MNLRAYGLPREIDQAIDRATPERGMSWSSHQYPHRVPPHPAGSVSAMDKTLPYLLTALAATLMLFAIGVFPCPFGLIVLALLALGRYLHIKEPA